MGDQRGWCVLGALTGAPPCSSQWKKDEATQAIICTILSASNTSLRRFALEKKKAFTEEQEEGGGRDLKKFGRERGKNKNGKNLDWRKTGGGWVSDWDKTEEYVQPAGTNNYLYGGEGERELT